MRVHRQLERLGYLLLITLGAIVLAFMGLSLAITATGTARFAVAMGYSAQVGYAVGAIFDFAKALLPVALLLLLARRAFLFFSIIACAWLSHAAEQRQPQRQRAVRTRDETEKPRVAACPLAVHSQC